MSENDKNLDSKELYFQGLTETHPALFATPEAEEQLRSVVDDLLFRMRNVMVPLAYQRLLDNTANFMARDVDSLVVSLNEEATQAELQAALAQDFKGALVQFLSESYNEVLTAMVMIASGMDVPRPEGAAACDCGAHHGQKTEVVDGAKVSEAQLDALMNTVKKGEA